MTPTLGGDRAGPAGREPARAGMGRMRARARMRSSPRERRSAAAAQLPLMVLLHLLLLQRRPAAALAVAAAAAAAAASAAGAGPDADAGAGAAGTISAAAAAVAVASPIIELLFQGRARLKRAKWSAKHGWTDEGSRQHLHTSTPTPWAAEAAGAPVEGGRRPPAGGEPLVGDGGRAAARNGARYARSTMVNRVVRQQRAGRLNIGQALRCIDGQIVRFSNYGHPVAAWQNVRRRDKGQTTASANGTLVFFFFLLFSFFSFFFFFFFFLFPFFFPFFFSFFFFFFSTPEDTCRDRAAPMHAACLTRHGLRTLTRLSEAELQVLSHTHTLSLSLLFTLAFPDAITSISPAATSQSLQRAPITRPGPGSTALPGYRVAH
eukprot:354720-Chlamydomonas_euryale.AAC.2